MGILIVDDEKDYARGLARLLKNRFPEEAVQNAFSGEEALSAIRSGTVSVMLTDLRMPSMNGLELLRKALDQQSELSIVVLTAYGSIETAVKALKAGAYDFLTKPIDPETLYKVVSKGLERSRLLGENIRLRSLLAQRTATNSIVGDSPVIRRLKDSIAAVAESQYTVLIRGESGTGKELVARTIHQLSRRSSQTLVTVNCPAIPDQLLESELFGHVKGAFTGADRDRKGLFEEARGGSILLDEIGDLSMSLQTKLLRCLQEQEIRPVGSSRNIRVDVRVLASTNQDLEEKIKQKSFREDLYYRINVLSVNVPPLRERKEDIPLLAHFFLKTSCEEMGMPIKEVTPEVLAYLSSQTWPGNVRELQNFIRRLAVFSTTELVDLNLLRLVEGHDPGGDGNGEPSLYMDAKSAVLDDFTRSYVQNLLQTTKGNISEAARVSGLSRVALQKILKRLDMEADQFRHS
ncbi:MAG: sigma-54-dependent transcriptional regulator [Desulfovibrionales bacterium]